MIYPGFRVTADELSNAEAIRLMDLACEGMVRTALTQRYDLVQAGFSVEHSLCQELDDVARAFAIKCEVVRRQRIAPLDVETGDVL